MPHHSPPSLFPHVAWLYPIISTNVMVYPFFSRNINPPKDFSLGIWADTKNLFPTLFTIKLAQGLFFGTEAQAGLPVVLRLPPVQEFGIPGISADGSRHDPAKMESMESMAGFIAMIVI